MNISDLKQGDVLLFSPEKGSFISWAITYLTNSNVSHAAMYYNDMQHSIIEETPPQVAVNNAEKRFKDRTIYVKRLKNDLPMTPVIDVATSYLNNEEPYDEAGLYIVGILLIYKNFSPNNLAQKVIVKILKKLTAEIVKVIDDHQYPDKEPMVCSQFVAQCYANAGSEYELNIQNGTIDKVAINSTGSVIEQVLDIVRSNKVVATQPLLMTKREVDDGDAFSAEELCKELQMALTSKTADATINLSDELVSAVSQFAYAHQVRNSGGKLLANNKECEADSFLQKLKDDENMFTFPSDLMDHCTNLIQVGVIEG
jgi:hypothetical protein